MLSRVFGILNSQSITAFLTPVLFVFLLAMSHHFTTYAKGSSITSQPNILLARNFDRNPEYPSTRKTKSHKQAMTDVKELNRRLLKIERRISELEVLEPVLKAEVLTVTKMAANATTLKERKEASKRIREAENNAIAVIRELKALHREFDAVKDETMLARKAAGLGSEFAKLGSGDARSLDRELNRLEHLTSKKEWREGLSGSPREERVARKIKRKTAKRLSSDTQVADLGKRTYMRSTKDLGKRAVMKPATPVIEESEFDDILGTGESSYEKALEKHFNAFLTLLDSIVTTEGSPHDEKNAQKKYDQAREELMRMVEEADEP